MSLLQSGTSGNRDSLLLKIFYAVVIALCLEYTRIRYNSLTRESAGSEEKIINRKQTRFIFRAAMVYAILFLFLLLKALVPLVGEITQVYEGMDFLASRWAFYILLVVCYTLSVLVVEKLLVLYIKTMNKAKGLFEALGRSVKDGSKFFTDKVVEAGSSVVKRTQGIVEDGRKTLFGRASEKVGSNEK